MALAMLYDSHMDPRVPPILMCVLSEALDPRMRIHAERLHSKYQEAGMIDNPDTSSMPL